MAEPVAPSRPASAARQHRASRRGGRPGRWARARLTAEHLWVLLLGLAVLAVHDVGYMLSQPFWNDEAWEIGRAHV